VAVSSTSIEYSSRHDFELYQTAKGSEKELPFLENKIKSTFNMIILGRSKCYYTVLLQQYFNIGLFRVLWLVMHKWFKTPHSQQVLATLPKIFPLKPAS